MRRNKTPQIDGHRVLLAGRADHPQQQPVKKHRPDRTYSENHSAGKGHKADTQIVGHDRA